VAAEAEAAGMGEAVAVEEKRARDSRRSLSRREF
jgi:hypothetical protein